MKENYYYENLSKSFTSIEGSKNGYRVIASKKFIVGEVIEECPIVETNTNFSHIINDMRIVSGTIPSDDEKMNIYLVSGNYVLYKTSPNNNAVSQHDGRFNILTIRAIKEINIGDEIILPSLGIEEETQMAKPKSGGCGCGKKKNVKTSEPTPTNQNESKTEVDNKTSNESSEFKSMVTGKNLKSIKVD